MMSRTYKDPVSWFVDIEARVEDGDDEEDEEDEMDNGASAPLTFLTSAHIQILDGFIEDSPTEKAQYTPWQNSDFSTNHSWTELISSLQERYGPRETPCVAKNHPAMRPHAMDTSMCSVLDVIHRSPTDADYPLWRIRCRVIFGITLVRVSNLFVPSSR
jgi:hypothetical protein